MEGLIATTVLLDDIENGSNIASITPEDVKRLNRQDYDTLDKMSKEELIRFIMGDDRYYNRF